VIGGDSWRAARWIAIVSREQYDLANASRRFGNRVVCAGLTEATLAQMCQKISAADADSCICRLVRFVPGFAFKIGWKPAPRN